MHAEVPPEQSLIEYPCDFPIKVMGGQAAGFVEAMVNVVRQFDVTFDPSTVEQRHSSGARYTSLTLTVRATDRKQLDELYRTLSMHPMVKVVL